MFNTIIFDLGGVIIDLSVSRTIQAFAGLSGKTPEQVLEMYGMHPEFIAYEVGEISDQQFRSAIREIFNLNVSDETFDKSWNAMLVDLPVSKLDLLLRLKQKFTVCLLSNTNNIHLEYINTRMLPRQSEYLSLSDYFHFPYYSHLLRMRKPNEEIFTYVLDQNNFDPGQTLFLDDNPDNIRTASKLGIQTVLVQHPDQVLDFFKGI